MKTTFERLNVDQRNFISWPLKSSKRRTFFPFVFLFAMGCAILLMDAILPLRDLWFHEAQLTQLGSWPVLPSLILFPGWALIPPIPQMNVTGVPQVIQSWEKIPLLLGSFVVVFLLYLLALRRLPEQVSRRYLFISTALLGILYALIPIVTSPDLYSYIAYARIGVIYHLNPLTTIPTAIRTDAIYHYIPWVDQPSAYGPTWAIITCSLQWVIALFRSDLVLPMVIALRMLGLVMHLVSTLLIWSISGHLQRLYKTISPTTRLRATLAFAWNPLLLFEACVNAHNDTTLLFLILLAIWFLVRNAAYNAEMDRTSDILVEHVTKTEGQRAIILAAVTLAFATCLKINVVLLMPGLLFYTWMQEPVKDRLKRIVIATATYSGVILLFYAPFWQGGAILDVFSVNPATYRSINTLADFLGRLYNGIVSALGYPIGATIGSPAESLMHTLSLGIFVIIYMVLCWRLIRRPSLTLQGLIGWMAITWLIYCAIGSPWFWPWYIITFLGLYALIEASRNNDSTLFDFLPWPPGKGTYFVRLLTFSMLSLYCFITWGVHHSFIPGLPGFTWSYLSGLWAWVLPVAGVGILVRGNRLNAVASPEDSD
jgi:hypothetical protein